jgi:putative acetyltransferase
MTSKTPADKASTDLSNKLIIREEQPQDIAAIRALNNAAFGQTQEGRIVDALRANGGLLLSLVATVDDRVVGHIAYSPVTIEAEGQTITGAGLGPMAVLPELQRRGIGSRLVEAGNQRMRDTGQPFIIVLGHAEYYPRFGFKPASTFGVRCEWEVPDEVFLLLALDEARLRGISGLARYREEFSSAE